MWRLTMATLSNQMVYKNQRITFMGTIKALVKTIFVKGQKVQSAFFDASTKPIFRSESARYMLFIQMSKEMWEFDTAGSGEIMFSKVTGGFLPELFKRWQQIGVKHLVSIVFFSRLEYEHDLPNHDISTSMKTVAKHAVPNANHQDFYRVVFSDVAAGQWASILNQLNVEFKIFLRDVSIQHAEAGFPLSLETRQTIDSTDLPPQIIAGRPSTASKGNILEAINLASSHFSCDHIDRDLVRTGLSIIVITPGTGMFEVDEKLLNTTSERLIAYGVGIDLVCLSRMPLHSVPLFKFRSQPTSMKEKKDLEATQTNSFKQPVLDSMSFTPAHFHLSKVPYDQTADPAGDCWKYGIPHWIDVSFWSLPNDQGTIDAGTTKESIKDNGVGRPLPKPFVPRASMYELQMLSGIENGRYITSIPYLAQYFSPIEESDQSIAETQPSMMDEKGLISSQRMDGYDNAIFRHRISKNIGVEEGKSWNLIGSAQGIGYKGSPYSAVNRPIYKHSASFHSHVGLICNDSSDQGSKGHNLQPKIHKRDSIESMTSNYSLPVPRKPSSSRRISLGPRGFRAFTLKSTPSTEISIQHANSASALSRGRKGRVSMDARSEPSTINLAEPELDKNKPKIDDLPNHTTQNPARPIPIRTITAVRVAEAAKPGENSSGEKQQQFGATGVKGDHESLKDPYPPLKLPSLPNDYQMHSSSGSSLAPWLTLLNPSNPQKADATLANRLGRWQHIFPRFLRASTIKWKSLCAPGAVPLTTEEFPSSNQITTDYRATHYNIACEDVSNQQDKTTSLGRLLEEMIAARFTHGFQVVVGLKLVNSLNLLEDKIINVFEENSSFPTGSTVAMSKGATIHILSYVYGGIDVRCLTRHDQPYLSIDSAEDAPDLYKPVIRSMLAKHYYPQAIDIFSPRKEADWESIDLIVSGREKLPPQPFMDHLRPWRARFVLIPVDPPTSARRALKSVDEDDEEEIRLEGIRKLTQLWQRHRYSSNERPAQGSTRPRKDTNPLDIMYRTRNPSAVIAAELENLGELELIGRPVQLLPESEWYERSSLDLASLAQAIQSEKGVRMMDRRWHWRFHYNCFIGNEFTTWLLQNFRDIDTRFQAVDFGNELMESGLFQHVEQRHNFRDGNYFYQIANDYRTPRPETSRSWFGARKLEKSVPSTPLSDDISGSSLKLPFPRPSSIDGDHFDTETPSTPTAKKQSLEVALSKSLLYDVGHRKKSHRSEVIALHYDRLHNPDNCYHIRIEWINATAKLVEDAVVSWATTVDRFGLRLVELPIAEAAVITEMHPFRAPYLIKLARHPPEQRPRTYFDTASLQPQEANERFFYQKAILKKFNFVLDLEAATDFPSDVEVTYSWGKPDYRYPQYIHRSGVLLVQVTDEGDFLLLANRLYNNRKSGNQEANKKNDMDVLARPRKPSPLRGDHHDGKKEPSPYSSPSTTGHPGRRKSCWDFASSGSNSTFTTPEQITEDFENFCKDSLALDQFYDFVLSRALSPGPNTPFIEQVFPALAVPTDLELEDRSSTLNFSGNGNVVEN